jgi:NAD(P)-dependent dehydrogenase (short-subunit alcohol dehydrogenase family)
MSRFRDRVAVVTGAGSGIGQALALGLAGRGARLALSDIDADRLALTADAVTAAGAQVHSQILDISDRTAVALYATQVAAHYGAVHQVYNNAGIAGESTVLANDYAAYERILRVNLWGVIHGTKEFLPYLIESGSGHVVNVSSINGVAAQPGGSAYSTSKFGVRGFTEALRAEMIAAKHPVRVSVVHPGGIRTNIANAALSNVSASGMQLTQADRDRVEMFNDKILKMPTHDAAAIILNGVALNRPRILVGNDARMIDAIARMAPRIYPRLVVALEKRLFGSLAHLQAANAMESL